VFKSISANLYAQLITVFTQLVSVPIFLTVWSAEEYGVWILMFAIPSYLSMADFGVLPYSSNKMTMEMAKGNTRRANFIFSNTCCLVLLASIFILILVGMFLVVVSKMNIFSLDVVLSVGLLMFTSLLCLKAGLIEAVFRSSFKYQQGIFLINTIRLVEFGFSVLLLFHVEGYVGAAMGVFFGRLTSTIALYIYVRRQFSIFTWDINLYSKKYIVNLLRNGFPFLSFPFGNLLTIQSYTLLAGVLFNPIFVAAFSSYRTLARLIIQINAIVSKSLWPVFSRLYATKKYEEINKKEKFWSWSMLGISLVLGMLLLIYGELVINYWTRGKISFDENLFALVLFVSLVNSAWQFRMVLFMATNNHVHLAKHYIVASIVAIIFSYALGSVVGMPGFMSGAIVFEIYMLIVCYFILSINGLGKSLT